MKNSVLQNAIVQSLVASLLCGVIVFAFLHQPSVFEQDGEITLMPKVTSSVRDCPLPSPQLAADGKLKLLLEDKAFFEYFFPAIQKRAEKYGLKDLHTHTHYLQAISNCVSGIYRHFIQQVFLF